MKLASKAFFVFFLLFSLNFQAAAQEYYEYDGYEYIEGWEIKSFDVEIYLNENSSFEVTEKIVADFSNEAHRGILRSLPYYYENDKKVKINYESALDDEGNPWAVETYKEYGYLNIPMKTHDESYSSEIETFILKYTVENAINYFPDENRDEFYWNVNGIDWPVKTNSVNATIHLPEKVEVELKCYTGKYGEEGYDCKWKEDGKAINFLTTRALEPYENLTVVIGLPQGILEKPSKFKQAWWIIVDNKGILLAPLTFILMFTLWFKRGRDDQTVKTTVMPHYKPPQNLLPSEVGTIIDENVNPHDILATIIDHAIKGHLKIKEIQEKKFIGKKTDYELELIKPWLAAKPYEDTILNGIFEQNKIGTKKRISQLQNKFYIYIEPIQKALIKQLIQDGYFPHNPMDIRSIYTCIGGVILIFSFFLSGVLFNFSIAATIGIIVSGLIILIFAFFMPRKTKKGTEAYYQLKGLHEYIDTAEKDRMKFQEDNNILFEKLLPYAMAFGLIQKWSKAFDGILKTPPTWFVPYGAWGNGFSMNNFASSLNNFSYKTTSNISSRPGGKGGGGGWSGGSGFSGGFSGGGFGGGGGRGL